MPLASTTSLVDALRQHELLEPKQLEEVLELQTRFPDPRALARELIQRGWLTPYQVNQLLQGNTAGLVLGYYVLLERLGEGGMGEVFKARHRHMKRIVAIKVIRKERLNNPPAVSRFLREVKARRKCTCPSYQKSAVISPQMLCLMGKTESGVRC